MIEQSKSFLQKDIIEREKRIKATRRFYSDVAAMTLRLVASIQEQEKELGELKKLEPIDD